MGETTSNPEPKADALAYVYDAATIERFHEFLAAAHANSADERNVTHVRWLVQVLTTRGEPPREDPSQAQLHARRLASRRALDAYVSAADVCGVLDANVVERLRSSEERNYRSARAECLTAWFLAGKLGHRVAPIAGGGRARKQLEFGATTHEGPLAVEVKASRVDVAWKFVRGDDFKALEKDMRDASDQFGKGSRNLLVLVPDLRMPVHAHRPQIEKLIGDRVMVVPVALQRDVRAPDPYPSFVPRGRFVRPGKVAEDGTRLPAHTRVSAVMTIEVVLVEDGKRPTFIDHKVLVVHNPNAEQPIDPRTFGDYPQLVKINEEEMVWTDRDEGEADGNDQ